jgi:hypothetical protein
MHKLLRACALALFFFAISGGAEESCLENGSCTSAHIQPKKAKGNVEAKRFFCFRHWNEYSCFNHNCYWDYYNHRCHSYF